MDTAEADVRGSTAVADVREGTAVADIREGTTVADGREGTAVADVREGTRLVSPKPQPSLSFELQRCGRIRVVLLYSPFQCLVCQIDASGCCFFPLASACLSRLPVLPSVIIITVSRHHAQHTCVCPFTQQPGYWTGYLLLSHSRES